MVPVSTEYRVWNSSKRRRMSTLFPMCSVYRLIFLAVARMFDRFHSTTPGASKIPQIVLYQPGIGSQTGFDSKGMTMNQSGEDPDMTERHAQMLGHFAASKIREVYMFIAQNYSDGDQICLFGLPEVDGVANVVIKLCKVYVCESFGKNNSENMGAITKYPLPLWFTLELVLRWPASAAAPTTSEMSLTQLLNSPDPLSPQFPLHPFEMTPSHQSNRGGLETGRSDVVKIFEDSELAFHEATVLETARELRVPTFRGVVSDGEETGVVMSYTGAPIRSIEQK
ncbi:hypothetical protein B0H14DRAFT_2587569 [Mycena olivaceomarginata]|nr:hypothetical protein B0H14DRAFT_2587569 [Mycena olivaceomarginata]